MVRYSGRLTLGVLAIFTLAALVAWASHQTGSHALAVVVYLLGVCGIVTTAFALYALYERQSLLLFLGYVATTAACTFAAFWMETAFKSTAMFFAALIIGLSCLLAQPGWIGLLFAKSPSPDDTQEKP